MAQFATVKELRDYVANLIAAELGTFGNGIARIWVKPSDPPAGVASGLECIIQRTPTGDVSNRSAGQKYFGRVWSLSLINYGNDGKLADAAEKIRASQRLTFYNRRNTRYLPPTEDNYEQTEFFIFDPVQLNQTA